MTKKFYTIIVVVFNLLTIKYFPQLSEGGIPYSYNNQNLSELIAIQLPAIDVAKLKREDELEQMKGLPFRFGFPHEVDLTLNNSGNWDYLPDGSKIWRLKISTPNANSINLVYNNFNIPKGAKFFIYNYSKKQLIGAFTYRNNKEDGKFATGLILDDNCILEYYEPAYAEYTGIIEISNVVQGYKNIFKDYPFWDDFGSSGACNINVKCPQGIPWENEIRSAAMIVTTSGSRLCSGSLVNNVRQDLKPYFLTANHCYSGSSNTWLIMFNYQSPNCSNINGPVNYTVSGTSLKARNLDSDFMLLLLNEAPPDSYRVHFAGWSRVDTPATTGSGIHHPSGDIKKISFSLQNFEHDTWSGTPANSHWRVRWKSDGTSGVTEPGSSGSPIFDQNHRIVGQLHGGPSSCTASDKSDLYGKFSMSWDRGTTPATRLKDWLDPDMIGVMFLDGWDPSIGNPDTIAPTTITDLTITNKTSNSLTLNWSAPLDTSFGGVKKYFIRYSTSPITDTITFANAINANYNGLPKPTGQPESFTIKNLNFNQVYYFAIRSQDFWKNTSKISNVPSDTTLFLPKISVTPNSISKIVTGNSVVKDSIRIKNISTNSSTLDYSIQFANNTFPNGKVTAQIIPVHNQDALNNFIIDKENKNEIYGQSIDGKGGPDSMGYKWIDSDEPNGPIYEWNDISTTGTLVSGWIATGTSDPKDEGYVGPINIGFPFKFYKQVKNQIYISTNGVVTFTQLNANMYSNSQIPNSAYPNDIICPFWDDLDGRTQGTVHYKQDGNKFTVQFTDWQKYSGQGSLTFQIVLYSSGKILCYYKNMVGTLNSATIGIENQTGTIGLQVAFNANYIKNNFALKFSSEPDWLSGNNLNGFIFNGNSSFVELTFKSEDFPVGNYSMDMIITSNDTTNKVVTVPVQMTIPAVPVELASFTAEAMNNEVNLRWTTATEVNNSGFTLERKKTDENNWKQITFVKGKGSTTEKSSYLFADKSLTAGKYFYRLTQIDFDGKSTKNKEIEVDVLLPKEFKVEQNYPNPFNPVTTIKFALPEKAKITIDVYSSLGEFIKTLINETKDAGYYSIDFNASSFSSGTYIYKYTAVGESRNWNEVKKMIYLK